MFKQTQTLKENDTKCLYLFNVTNFPEPVTAEDHFRKTKITWQQN